MSESDPRSAPGLDFIRTRVEEDLEAGRYGGRVHTRFPPEPNGYLHIGHAKAITLNFDIAREYGGLCNLRFDDTNPETEEWRYVEAIQEDVRWLGYDWDDRLRFASDYFEELYGFAVTLIEKGKAYVDSLSEEEIREYRGTVTEPGRESPYRDRPVEESLDLFRRMREGAFDEGEHVLRAKIRMDHPNMVMRDPVLYRIRYGDHYRTGTEWCVYPLYDFTHCLSDALEEITHSLCSLEFENNRELYDWILDEVGFEEPRPHQYEFARLNLDYTVMSKRKLLRLVREGLVDGWDDPRMPTLAGFRRRGVTPASIRSFCRMVGVAKADSRVDMGKLEYAIRDDLNTEAPRVLCVLRPLKVVVESWPEDEVDELEAPHWPRDIDREGSRTLPFSRELWIDRDDFRLDPPDGFYRLAPGREVRLRYGYIIRCREVVTDEAGRVVELRCTHDPESRGGSAPDGRTVKGTIQWVSAEHALRCEVRLYDRLFDAPDPEDVPEGEDFTANLHPHSLDVVEDARIEPSVADDPPETRYQFEREGYFWRDPEDSSPGSLVFNRIVSLRDTWKEREAAARKAEEARRAEERRAREEAARRAREAAGGGPAFTRSEIVAELRTGPGDEAAARFERYVDGHGLDLEDARTLALDPGAAALFDAAVAAHDAPESVANWIVNELPRELDDDRGAGDLPFGGDELAALVEMVDADRISAAVGRQVLGRLVREGGDPRTIVRDEGLEKIDDREALETVVEAVLGAHPEEVRRYREGQEGLLGFFVGRVMAETGGRADPRLAKELLSGALASDGES